MTILFDKVEDIAGATEHTPIVFWAPQVRQNSAGDGIVTPQHHTVYARNGVFTTPDLDVGPAFVQIGMDQYAILVPASATPISLWPLIDAGLPAPPPSEQYQFVRNGGGVVRTQAVTQVEYDSMSVDPETLYVIIGETVL